MRAACLPSTTVTVTVNGNPLQERQQTQIDAGADKGASAFIESIDGAAFAVELDLEAGLAVYVQFTIYVDGEFMGGSVVDLRAGKQNTNVAGVRENSGDGVAFRRFMFVRHDMTDERPDSSLKKKLKGLGEIKAVLNRCQVTSRSTGPIHGPGFESFGEEYIALEGRSIFNHVIIGNPEPSNDAITTCQVTYPFKKKHLGTFVFKHRSHKLKLMLSAEDLQNEGIIERSPSSEGISNRTQKRHRSATVFLSSDDEKGHEAVVGAKRTKIVIDLTDD